MTVILMVIFCTYFSLQAANNSPTRDFAAFYYGSKVVLDSSLPNSSAYDGDLIPSLYSKYEIPIEPLEYLYSIPVAYLLSPITLFSYTSAKIVWSILSLVIYLLSVILILRWRWVSGAQFNVLLSVSLIWIPIYLNQFWLQSNSLILFLIVIALLAASKQRHYLSGSVLALAALFKLFPLAIAMVLGLKNWRIIVGFVVVFGLSMLIPGSTDWFTRIAEVHHPNYTTTYRLLDDNWVYVYVIVIAGITALVTWLKRDADYAMLAAIAIPAALLTSPVVGGYYLVIAIFSYVYLFTVERPKWLVAFLVASLCLTDFIAIIYDQYTIGLLVLWVVTLAYLLVPMYIYTRADPENGS